MNLTLQEQRLLRRLNRPSHQFNFHLAAALVMLAGGVLNVIQGLRVNNAADLWLGCLVGAISIFWLERLVYNRLHQRLIGKLLRNTQGVANGERHENFY